MPFLRQHSSLSHSHSTAPEAVATVAEEVTIAEEGEEEPLASGKRSEPEGASDRRHRLAKVTSTEDEVARLTIEVSPSQHRALSHGRFMW